MPRGEDREKYDGAMAASTKPHPLANRKGATKRELVPVEVKEALERGEIETANLVEGLTIDFDVLLQHVAPGAPRLVEEGIVKRMREAAGISQPGRPSRSTPPTPCAVGLRTSSQPRSQMTQRGCSKR